MYPAAIAGFSLIWYDSFTRYTTDPSSAPYKQWDGIKVEPNAGTGEIQFYDTTEDLTYVLSYPPSMPGNNEDQLFILPQHKDGRWTSTRLEGKAAHGCPEGKSLILQAELRAGNASSDKQGGVWPAFWALGESRNDGVEWPLCGEWDIFEASDGHDWSLASLHWGVKNDAGDIEKHDAPSGNTNDRQHKFDHTQFHTWALKVDRTNSNWKDQTIQWLMDGEKFDEVKGSDVGTEKEWLLLAEQAYYPVLNVAIGTNFPGMGRLVTQHQPDWILAWW
ncbi:glycosyl hydrolase family 16 [Colletotrichum kahawae]|uniref:Glycosyl hydrolase family 16 n=1 Tax=Colletotrichum kahawae TaxID=34407 RepID=A0AAE0D5V8_COLKA|nr:glycosyl hydrolase family 16 [Colletotrichum kahawae]